MHSNIDPAHQNPFDVPLQPTYIHAPSMPYPNYQNDLATPLILDSLTVQDARSIPTIIPLASGPAQPEISGAAVQDESDVRNSLPPIATITDTEQEEEHHSPPSRVSRKDFSLDELFELVSSALEVNPWAAKHGELSQKWAQVAKRFKDAGGCSSHSNQVLKNKVERMITLHLHPKLAGRRNKTTRLLNGPGSGASVTVLVERAARMKEDAKHLNDEQKHRAEGEAIRDSSVHEMTRQRVRSETPPTDYSSESPVMKHDEEDRLERKAARRRETYRQKMIRWQNRPVTPPSDYSSDSFVLEHDEESRAGGEAIRQASMREFIRQRGRSDITSTCSDDTLSISDAKKHDNVVVQRSTQGRMADNTTCQSSSQVSRRRPRSDTPSTDSDIENRDPLASVERKNDERPAKRQRKENSNRIKELQDILVDKHNTEVALQKKLVESVEAANRAFVQNQDRMHDMLREYLPKNA